MGVCGCSRPGQGLRDLRARSPGGARDRTAEGQRTRSRDSAGGQMITRRGLLAGAGLAVLNGRAASATTLEFLARRRNADGGYGWSRGEWSHITPTFAAVGCYRLLGQAIPEAARVAEFARSHYP